MLHAVKTEEETKVKYNFRGVLCMNHYLGENGKNVHANISAVCFHIYIADQSELEIPFKFMIHIQSVYTEHCTISALTFIKAFTTQTIKT